MQIDSCEGQQACIEPVEELIQKLQALKLGEDNDERSPQLLSTRMDDVQVDIPHDSWLHIGLDLRMRDIDDDDDDDGDDDDDDDDAIYDFESGDGVSNGYSCQFTSRFPTLETFDRGYESPQNRLDSSSNDASDCEIRDLSDALSMLSLDMEPEPDSPGPTSEGTADGIVVVPVCQGRGWQSLCQGEKGSADKKGTYSKDGDSNGRKS
ncbi:MAG: hypothetical protein STHCBS139747_004239 [Sporothrix thermara]